MKPIILQLKSLNDEFCVLYKRLSADFKAFKMRNVRPGKAVKIGHIKKQAKQFFEFGPCHRQS